MDTALGRYFNARIERTSLMQAGARKNARVFHKPGFAYAPLRLAARLKPGLMHERMDWVYRHAVPARP